MKLVISADEALEAIAYWLEQKKGLTVSPELIGAIIEPGGYDHSDEWGGFSVELGSAAFAVKNEDQIDEPNQSMRRIP